MIKILIADDEKTIRNGIVNLVKNIDNKNTEIFAAKNGKEAYTIFLEENPDIVITDIRMPLLDGIKLTNKIRLISKATQIIFVTGYSDIEYLKSAFNNQVVNYILKPVDLAEFNCVIKNTINTVLKEQKNFKLLQLMQDNLKRSMPLLIKKFYSEVLNGVVTEYEEIKQKIELYQLPIEIENDFIIAVISVDYKKSDLNTDINIANLLVEDIINKTLLKNFYGLNFINDNDEFVILIKTDMRNTEIKESFQKIHAQIKRILNADAYSCIGPSVSGLMHISESYKYAQQSATYRFYISEEKIIFAHNLPANTTDLSFKQLQTIADYFRLSDFSNVEKELEKFLDDFSRKNIDIDFVKTFSVLLVSKIINSKTDLTTELIAHTQDAIEQLHKCKSTSENKKILLTFVNSYAQFNKKEYGGVIHEIIDMLNEHLSDNITIYDIAKKVYLTPNYICNIFKKATGKTINEYYTDLKIDAAKKMLKKSDLKLYEISYKVGYQDVKYFSKLFKQKEGVTPSKYKES